MVLDVEEGVAEGLALLGGDTAVRGQKTGEELVRHDASKAGAAVEDTVHVLGGVGLTNHFHDDLNASAGDGVAGDVEVVIFASLLALGGRGGGRLGRHLRGRDGDGDENGLGVADDVAPLGKCAEISGEAELSVPEAGDGGSVLDAFVAEFEDGLPCGRLVAGAPLRKLGERELVHVDGWLLGAGHRGRVLAQHGLVLRRASGRDGSCCSLLIEL